MAPGGSPSPFARRWLPLGLLMVALLYLTSTFLSPGAAVAPPRTHSVLPQVFGELRAQSASLDRSLLTARSQLNVARVRLESLAMRAQPIRAASTGLGSIARDLAHTQADSPQGSSATSSERTTNKIVGSNKCVGECRHGTCNSEIGRCDCEPFFSGPDCAAPLFPACSEQYGMRPHIAPCGIFAQPAFPTTCECMLQCFEQGLDARQECLVEPSPSEAMEDARERLKKLMNFMPMVANETVLRMTRQHAEESLAKGSCSGNGILSTQLPYTFYPKAEECVPTDRRYNLDECARQRIPMCRCFPGFTGSQCEINMEDQLHLHKCFNGCSGRGTCKQNWCKCRPGHWGIDCSLNASSVQLAAAAAAAAHSPPPRPRIYVYDLPPRWTSWLAAFRRGDWTRDHWYGADVILHQQLLKSPHRELDPSKADFFFVPMHLSLGFYTHRYYFKHFTSVAAKPLREAIAYVRRTWPYFDRKGGADHLLVMSQDQGNRFVRDQLPELKNVIFIHHWGALRSVRVDGGAQGDHVQGHDITVPPFHGEQWRMSRYLPPKAKTGAPCKADAGEDCNAWNRPAIDRVALAAPLAEASFKRVLFFSGKMNFNWGRHYSLGVRQAVYRAHRRHPDVLIMTFDKGVQEKLPLSMHVENYASAKFCLAPAGYGFSSRQYEAVLVGCVPIVIQDGVEMAFEETLPWERFSIRLNFSEIPALPYILEMVPPHVVARMRRGLACIWPRMVWLAQGLYRSAPPGNPDRLEDDALMVEARPHDAFAYTMVALRRRLGVPEDVPWRAPVSSCVVLPGDDDPFDLDLIRAKARTLAAERMNEDARAVNAIISEWLATGDDKTFAMRTRYFPSGVKPAGFLGAWTP